MEEINNNSNNIKHMRLIKWTLKDGTIKTSYVDNRPYEITYREKHKDRINKKNECEICHGSYSVPNKAKHCRTSRHIKCYEALKEKSLIE